MCVSQTIEHSVFVELKLESFLFKCLLLKISAKIDASIGGVCIDLGKTEF